MECKETYSHLNQMDKNISMYFLCILFRMETTGKKTTNVMTFIKIQKLAFLDAQRGLES